jgi:predicted phage terminase large subunit-like protein
MAMSPDGRLLQALLRNDFRAFVEKVFLTLTPGQPYIRSWHLEAIAYQLERVRRGEIKRLIINMPPRSLKSITASVAFPAFILGLDPTRRIICASYSGELAKKHSNDFRAVLDSRWTGFLTDQSDEWNTLNLPAIAEHDCEVPCWNGEPHLREAGEVLSPEREPLRILEAMKMQIGSDAFSAQYQQMPVPPGGAMIKRAWIVRYKELPPASERLTIVQSWDTANKGGPQNDWSVCTTWLMATKMRWYLLDVWRGRVDYPGLKSIVESHAKLWKATRVLVEDAAAGTMLVSELRARVAGIIGVKPEGDKASRLAVASAKFEAGQAYLPERAPWLADLEAELFAFPGGKHDDQCDSISQALLHGSISWTDGMGPDDWRNLLAQASIPSRYSRRRWS